MGTCFKKSFAGKSRSYRGFGGKNSDDETASVLVVKWMSFRTDSGAIATEVVRNPKIRIKTILFPEENKDFILILRFLTLVCRYRGILGSK